MEYKYNFINKPKIIDKFHKEFIVTEKDLYNDVGDCVHVKHPNSKEEFRFYYEIKNGVKVLDGKGIIQF